MRILLLIHFLGSGGAERVAVNMANHWAGQGWTVALATLAGAEHDFYPLHPQVERIALGLDQPSRYPWQALQHNAHRVWAVRRLLRAWQPAVALGLMTTANVLLALAASGLPFKTVGSEHTHPPKIPLGFIWEALRKFCYPRLDALTALTQRSADWLQPLAKRSKVAVIPNAVPWPLQSFEPQLGPGSIRSNQHRLLAVGRLVPEKGYDLLLRAFRQIAAIHADWDLVVLGEGGLRADLQQQTHALGLAERVHWVGRVGNVADWYQTADLFVMSSRFEGFGNTLAEAMACGLPAVSFDCETGPADIIRHEVDGVLVPAGNVDALAQALSRLMRDGALRQQYAERAVDARERFSVPRVAAQWEALFESIKCRT